MGKEEGTHGLNLIPPRFGDNLFPVIGSVVTVGISGASCETFVKDGRGPENVGRCQTPRVAFWDWVRRRHVGHDLSNYRLWAFLSLGKLVREAASGTNRNADALGWLLWGPLMGGGGGPQCRMSILRKAHVTCHLIPHVPCRL